MNIKEQLEQWIEQEGDKLPQFDTNYMDLQQAYKAGANEMKELLLIAIEALEDLSLEQEFYIKSKDYFSEVVRLNLQAQEALAKIQEKIKG